MVPNDIIDDIQRANREGWYLSIHYDEVKLEHVAALTKTVVPFVYGHSDNKVLMTRARTAKAAMAKVLERWADTP